MILLLLSCQPDPKPDSDSGTTDTATDTGTTRVPGTVEMGALCPITGRIGQITIMASGDTAYLNGQVYDRPDPWYGAPELSTETCDFHRFNPSSCGDCPEGEICGIDGACTPQPRSHLDLQADVTGASGSWSFAGDALSGQIYGDVGGAGESYRMQIRFGAQIVDVPEMAVAPGGLDYVLTLEGDSMAPGALDLSWTPQEDGALVTTLISINHHAAGPTFTACAAATAAGSLRADAEMIDPLAVVTGLEFQGANHVNVAAAWTEEGCVELRYGTQDWM